MEEVRRVIVRHGQGNLGCQSGKPPRLRSAGSCYNKDEESDSAHIPSVRPDKSLSKGSTWSENTKQFQTASIQIMFQLLRSSRCEINKHIGQEVLRLTRKNLGQTYATCSCMESFLYPQSNNIPCLVDFLQGSNEITEVCEEDRD